MPEHIAIDQLSENQQRARHIALNLAEYARRTPNGRVLRAGDLRTVLKARFETGHSETVDRVRTFLDELGGDETEVMEPRTAGFSPSKKAEKRAKGKQLVVDESLARRLTRIEADHDVVTAARVCP